MLLNELGYFLLLLAGGLSAIQFIAPTIGFYTANYKLCTIGAPAAKINAVVLILAFLILVNGFVKSDFSLEIVANNSHTLKPLLYKIAGTWGNHEGSLLVWVLILAIMGASISIFSNPQNIKKPQTNISTRQLATFHLHYRALSIQGLISLAFISFSALTSNPFSRLYPVPLEGAGLNPLLQDPGLAFHPPLLYMGYVGLSVAFSFAAASLVNGRIDALWARCMRPWVIFAWSSLSAGILLGSWWAYYELGWGGFWFWDPVENASFMPWLSATALLHSVIVAEKRSALRAWTALLGLSAFSFSLLGTFIVRSGVITSVHAFASDPKRGVWILALLSFSVGGALFLYALRAPLLKSNNSFMPASKEGGLVINNLLLSVAAGIILTGTLYPVVLEAITGVKISVGAPYFEKTVVPIFAAILVGGGIVPFINWRRINLKQTFKKFKITILLAIIFSTIIIFFIETKSILGAMAIFLTQFLFAASLLEIRGHSMGKFKIQISRLPMILAHAGLGLFALGAVGSTLGDEKITTLRIGQQIKFEQFNITLEKITSKKIENYNSTKATLKINTQYEKFILSPEIRTYISTSQPTTESAIKTTILYDLYIAMGDAQKGGDIVFRIYKKPLTVWLWIGGILVVLGGIMAFFATTRRRYIKKVKEQKNGKQTK